MKKTRVLILLLLIASVSNTMALNSILSSKGGDVKLRVDSILHKMTLREKIDYIGGTQGIRIRGIERLGVPELIMSDGPLGINNGQPSTVYPAPLSLSATWNPNLAAQFGKQVGLDARARGIHIWLAPGVNIYRSPLCGRNFEYLGEDPYLSSQMVVPIVKNAQDQGVLATVKHFAGNNHEYNRRKVNSEIDEGTLNEIYLPAFKAAVQKADVHCVMTAFNKLNGVYCSHSDYLMNKLLKDDWGFKGFVMSDWEATYDGIAAANSGLDLEMPSGKSMNYDVLSKAILDGKVKETTIDDKVRRILTTAINAGFFDRPQKLQQVPLDNPESNKTALNIAREGIILLKNKNNLLPLNREKIKSIAVIGPNAHPAVWGGGGSSNGYPFHSVSFYDGIRNVAGEKIQVRYEEGISKWYKKLYAESEFSHQDTNGVIQSGLQGEYFDNMKLEGSPKIVRTDKVVNIPLSGGSPADGFAYDEYSVRWTGYITPKVNGEYAFVAEANDGVRVWINNELIVDDWNNHADQIHTVTKMLEGGQSYSVKIEYYEYLDLSEVHFGWGLVQDEYKNSAVQLAKDADVAVVCVGFNPSTEQEASDRPFALPEYQNELIQQVSKVNKNTIVVLNAGGSVDAGQWIDKIPSFIHTIYPGQDGGQALAEILFGDVNPSGHLPFSYEKKWADNPCAPYYHTSNPEETKYTEGLFVGYRGFDKKKIKPLFPFGFGLSYTSFKYNDLKVDRTKDKVTLKFEITNVGNKSGADVAQVYVSDLNCSVDRPVKELKAFKKVFLEPGRTSNVVIELDKNAFSYYSVRDHDWIVEPGKFKIQLGTSSRDIKLSTIVNVSSSVDLAAKTNKSKESFQVGIFWPPVWAFTNDEQYKNIKEANVDYIQNVLGSLLDTEERNLKMLSLADKYGLKVYVADPRVHGTLEDLKTMVNTYKGFKATAGYYIVDEPGADSFAKVAKTYQEIVSLDSTRVPYVNLLPEWAVPDYQASYVDKWIETVGKRNIKYLSFDSYPFMIDGTFREAHYRNLDIVRDAGLKNDIKTSCYLQSIGIEKNYRRPKSDELRYSAYSSLAYGIKNVVWFTYWTPTDRGEAFTTSIIDPQGNKTDLYEPFRSINSELRQLGKTLIHLDAHEVYHFGNNVPDCVKRLPESFLWQPLNPSDELIISSFLDQFSRKHYVMVVNKSLTEQKEIKFQLDNSIKQVLQVSKLAGKNIATNYNPKSGIISDLFMPGEGKLYELKE
ncbi:MAG: glycoside hydrolase family 3 C-terminal domain-containing protein [Bacteroidota bacterium]|nr:glycoside hydrolase family 3 C-terminal domain-containing protein [Bacteroidota bacterium]